ncbi:MAG TPA: VWA domain-containing protein [Thermoleophilaceae bacterium]
MPVAVVALAVSRRRARRYAVRFTAAPSLRLAGAAVPAWRRYLPALAALAAIVALVLALARPEQTVAVPVERASVILVTDHSRSMLAEDVDPDRMTAAKRAARTFIEQLPDAMRIGAVAFSDFPDAIRAPSQDHSEARGVIDSQVADGATATGDALGSAVDLLRRERQGARKAPAAIVLLSDGKTTVGRNPVDVAEEARRIGVPIYTVSLGTTDATVPNPGFGPPLPATPDPETLAAIAETSGGRAFSAEDDAELSSIYRTLGSRLGTREQKQEVSAKFAAVGFLLLLTGAAGSVRRGARLP